MVKLFDLLRKVDRMWEVIGHEWAVELLRQSIARGSVAHSYLFTGPDGVGKRTLALEMARALCCEGSAPPCGECESCRRVKAGTHPDVVLVEPEKGSIKIERMRELRRRAALAPHLSRYKVYIISDMEKATPEAANSLLKTLEEPPSHLVIILTASNAEALLPTIVSRCQVLNLRPLPVALIEQALQERWGVQKERAALLARLSTGCLGWAVRAHSDEAMWQRRARLSEDLLALLKSDIVERFSYVARLSKDGEEAREVVELWLKLWRDMLLLKEGAGDRIINLDFKDRLMSEAEALSYAQLRRGLESLKSTLQALDKNVNLRLALEVLMLDLPRPK